MSTPHPPGCICEKCEDFRNWLRKSHQTATAASATSKQITLIDEARLFAAEGRPGHSLMTQLADRVERYQWLFADADRCASIVADAYGAWDGENHEAWMEFLEGEIAFQRVREKHARAKSAAETPLNDAPTVRPAVTQVAEPDRSNGPSVNEGAIPSGAATYMNMTEQQFREWEELYTPCKAEVANWKALTVSNCQRLHRLGYNRAARIMEALEAFGTLKRNNKTGAFSLNQIPNFKDQP